MARKRRSDDGGGYSWMDTYGDMVTLLLTFFILLFSMSTVDESKWKILVQALSRNGTESPQQVAIDYDENLGDEILDAEGQYELMVNAELDLQNDRPVDMSELYQYLKAYVEQNNMQGSVSIERDMMNNVYMRFDNNIFFNGDSAVLRPESFPVLTFMGECLKSVEDKILTVRVVGHTAAVAQKDYPVNDWDLSAGRANRVTTFFEEESGFDATKLMTSAYGKNKPRFSNVTPEGRAQNRRVEIMVLGNDFTGANSDDLLTVLQMLTDTELEKVPDPANGSDILAGDAPETPLEPGEENDAASTPPAGDTPADGSQPVSEAQPDDPAAQDTSLPAQGADAGSAPASGAASPVS